MDMTSLTGGFQDPPILSARAFRAAMTAMARPGAIVELAGAAPPAPLSVAAGVLLLTLCDPDTPLWLAPSHDMPVLRQWIAFHCGAPFVPAEAALFALGAWDALAPHHRFATGTAEYPDRSATLIVETDRLEATGTRLTGPGIRDAAALSLPDPETLRANAALFPLGYDCFFTCGARAAALPRSTRIG